jgi:hypothetical protein
LDASLGQNTRGPNNIVGVTSSATDAQGANTFPDLHMSNKALHVLTIGACIIDQADPDSIPTRIQFKPSSASVWWTAYGVESLPYITQIYPIAGTSPFNSNLWATYLLFQLWNPHIGGALPTPAPQVRLRVDGSIGIFSNDGTGHTWATSSHKSSPYTIPPTGVPVTQMALASGALGPGSTPVPLSTPGVAATGPGVGTATLPGFEKLPPPSSGSGITNYVGLRLPDFTLGAGSPSAPVLGLYFGTLSTQQFNATMECTVDGGTTWIPYNHFIGIIDRNSTISGVTGSWINGASVPVRTASSTTGLPSGSDQFNASRLTDSPLPDCLMKSDPRATRFGIFQFKLTTSSATARIADPLWPTSNGTYPNGYGGPIADPAGPVEHAPLRFSTSGGGNGIYFPATLCVNNAASTSSRTSYADGDGVIRPADATYPDPSVATTGSSTPYYNTSTDYHPLILNRPLRNVAELGCAFRDLPWKTLDFFTDKSADAGLLDVFCTNDGTPLLDGSGNTIGVAGPTMVAGPVNLSGQQAPVLQSVLASAIWDEISSSTIAASGSSAQTAQTMATNIVNAVSTTPMQNRSELITRSGLPLAILPLPATSQSNQTVKARREVVARAISSLSQTRTWNLLIDVIAQSGHYPPNANSLAGFMVEGEQHYWVHVAIDRLTGQVIDKQIEVVTE